MTHENKNEQLLEIIRRQVALARFSRRALDVEEIVNEVFLRLLEKPAQLESLESHINVMIRRILRKERATVDRFRNRFGKATRTATSNSEGR